MPGITESGDLTVVAMENGVGADVLGFDFEAMPPHQVEALRSAWLKYGLL